MPELEPPGGAAAPDTRGTPQVTVTDACMGAQLCTAIAPQTFTIRDGRSTVTGPIDPEQVLEAAESCPLGAILLE